MYLTASTAVALLSLVASSHAADSVSIDLGAGGAPGAIATPDHASLVSDLLAKASSQVSDPAFKSALSTNSAASGVDIPKDIASAAQLFAFSSGPRTVATPAWVSAAGSTGVVASVWTEDILGLFGAQAAAATPISTSGMATSVSTSMSTGSGSTSSTNGGSGSTSSTNGGSGSTSSTNGGSNSTSTMSGSNSASQGSTTASPSSGSASQGSTTASQSSPVSSQSKGGAASQPTGVIMAAGAAAAGVLGLAVML